MRKIQVEYIKIGCHWTYEITNNGLKTIGDEYPGTKKGLKAMKRDSADIVKHLRANNEILVKRCND
jgi:hypothetical protein